MLNLEDFVEVRCRKKLNEGKEKGKKGKERGRVLVLTWGYGSGLCQHAVLQKKLHKNITVIRKFFVICLFTCTVKISALENLHAVRSQKKYGTEAIKWWVASLPSFCSLVLRLSFEICYKFCAAKSI